MSELVTHISIIQTKLQQLLKQYEILLKENARQLEHIGKMEHELAQHTAKMEELSQQNLLLKASVTDMDPADKKLLEQKIQHYIKNIDKCISLLSQ